MRTLLFCLTGLLVCLPRALPQAPDDGPETRIFDSGKPLPAQLAAQALVAKPGWQLVPEDTIDHRFTGDLVLLNDKIALVFRQGQPGPAVYSRGTGKKRATIRFAVGTAASNQVMTSCRIVENTGGGGKIESAFGAAGTLRLRLTTGESIVEIQAPQGAGSVEVESDSRYVVVSDYFGDDLLYAAGSDEGPLPAENFCLNLLSDGDGMLMTVWQSNEQEASLARAGADATSGQSVNRIRCLKDKNIWVALLEQPGVWRARTNPAEAWKPPFPAKWRSSLVRERNMADSWDAERGPGPEQKPGSSRGPLLTYLMDRSIATPLTVTCPTDVMRNTLGVGPCQYILACEGMAAQGDPTPNSVMGWVEKQFEQKKQRKAADDIKERLGQMVKHAAEARSRIERYAAFGSQVRKTLTGKPNSAGLKLIADDLDRFAAAGLIEQATGERATQLAEQVIQLLGQPNGLAACQRVGEQLRAIGAVQDRALARCRMAVRRLRQEARASSDSSSAAPGPAEGQEVQRLCEEMLRSR